MSERRVLGFDRKLELAWLDAAASTVAVGAKPNEAREQLWRLLDGVLAGEKSNGARGKTTTVLLRVWVNVPEPAKALRARAVALLQHVAPEVRLGLHWAMLLAAYPFFVDLASGAGRLLALQRKVAASQLTRRIVEAWGDRSTLPRAVQRLLRSMIQWGVLNDTATRGVYEARAKKIVLPDEVAELLLEALLLNAAGTAVPFEQLVGHPALFPFELRLTAHQLRRASQFRVHRQGLDSDVVELA